MFSYLGPKSLPIYNRPSLSYRCLGFVTILDSITHSIFINIRKYTYIIKSIGKGNNPSVPSIRWHFVNGHCDTHSTCISKITITESTQRFRSTNFYCFTNTHDVRVCWCTSMYYHCFILEFLYHIKWDVMSSRIPHSLSLPYGRYQRRKEIIILSAYLLY